VQPAPCALAADHLSETNDLDRFLETPSPKTPDHEMLPNRRLEITKC